MFFICNGLGYAEGPNGNNLRCDAQRSAARIALTVQKGARIAQKRCSPWSIRTDCRWPVWWCHSSAYVGSWSSHTHGESSPFLSFYTFTFGLLKFEQQSLVAQTVHSVVLCERSMSSNRILFHKNHVCSFRCYISPPTFDLGFKAITIFFVGKNNSYLEIAADTCRQCVYEWNTSSSQSRWVTNEIIRKVMCMRLFISNALLDIIMKICSDWTHRILSLTKVTVQLRCSSPLHWFFSFPSWKGTFVVSPFILCGQVK